MSDDDRPDIAPVPEPVRARMDGILDIIAANEARRHLTDERIAEWLT